MARFFPAILLIASLAHAEDWVFFRSGPVEVWTNADHDAARKVLATFDQMRWWMAKILGRVEITPLWPVRIAVVKADRGAASRRTSRLRLSREAYTGGLTSKDAVPAAWLTGFARILLDDDTRRMPDAIENGLIELLSTFHAEGVRIRLGTPPAQPGRAWARLHFLCVNPVNAGRARVFLTNVQQGAEFDIAYRNAFEKTEKEMEADLDAYVRAARYLPEQISGRPLDPERDYRPRTGDAVRAQLLLADNLEGEAAQSAYRDILNQHGAHAGALDGARLYQEATLKGSGNARAWAAYARQESEAEKARAALRKAIELNPRWGEPHARYAELETAPNRKIPIYQRAAQLEPRNTEYWIALAAAQTDSKQFDAAARSWRSAVLSASEAQRPSVERRQRDYEARRLDLKAAEQRRLEEEKRRELQRLKDETLAGIRAAEARANAAAGPSDPGRKAVDWWDGPQPSGAIEGTLERIDCLNGPARLHIRESGGKLSRWLIPDPGQVAVPGGGDLNFSCGPQKPARRIRIEYQAKSNARYSTLGEVLTLEFRK